MTSRVDLYDNVYARVEHELYRLIRAETYGQDLGQTSWVTTEESERIPVLLGVKRESRVLEIGCGSGMYAIHLAKRVGVPDHRCGCESAWRCRSSAARGCIGAGWAGAV